MLVKLREEIQTDTPESNMVKTRTWGCSTNTCTSRWTCMVWWILSVWTTIYSQSLHYLRGFSAWGYYWDKIALSTRCKTEWKFHLPGSQLRNGAVEAILKKLKRSLSQKFASRMMFLLELETVFRPFYARSGPRGGGDPAQYALVYRQ